MTFDPQILPMDEPFGALDELTRDGLNLQLLDLWARIRVTIIIITHSLSEAVFLADRVIVLSKRPSHVDEILTVPFKRPRTLSP
jgi:NitT/TauT family transport system ATP-binding protein